MANCDFIQISRDPFARHDIVRRKAPAGDCTWCGQHRDRRYEYGTWTDGGTMTWHKGQFCNKSCFDSWHD